MTLHHSGPMLNRCQTNIMSSLDRHFAIRQKVLNREPIVYELIIELQKNCESAESLRNFMKKKANIYQLAKLFVQCVNI